MTLNPNAQTSTPTHHRKLSNNTRNHLMPNNTILITVASTGFGRDTAETLKRAGHVVLASMRDPQGENREHANRLREQGIDVIELNVTNNDSVERAVRSVSDKASCIDVL